MDERQRQLMAAYWMVDASDPTLPAEWRRHALRQWEQLMKAELREHGE